MKSSKLGVLMKKYAECPECGSDKIGEHGVMTAGTDTFTRGCKCGFSITVDEDDNEV